MQLRKPGYHTNGCRHQINIDKSSLSKTNRLVKNLMKGTKQFMGRSSVNGRITVRHKGGGCKRVFRKVNFGNSSTASISLLTSHDPFRNSFISLNYEFLTGSYFYSLSTKNVAAGALLTSNQSGADLRLGSRMPLLQIPVGSIVHSVAKSPKKEAQYIRSAGTFGQLIQKDFESAKVRLPSGRVLQVSSDAFATLGVVSNLEHSSVVYGKAGRSRSVGRRPCVRGIAMNPVDHPHGGRTNGGMPSVTPWGIPTKGKPTVRKLKQ